MTKPKEGVTRAKLETEFLAGIKSIPRSWVVNHLTGLTPSQVRDILTVLELPALGPEVDLGEFFPSVFRWFLANRDALRSIRSAGGRDWVNPQDRLAEVNVKLKELEYLQQCGRLVPADWIDEQLGAIAGRLSGVAERLQKRFGEEAYVMLAGAIEGLQRDVEAFGERLGLGQNDSGDQ